MTVIEYFFDNKMGTLFKADKIVVSHVQMQF